MWPGRRRGYRTHIGLLLLLLEMCQAGLDRIPPVTLGTIALNVAVFLRLIHSFFNKRFPHPLQVCAGVTHVWYGHDYWRIIEATFHHADDWHLYFNMISFLWKGKSLEPRIGSKRFFCMIAVFSVLVNTVMLYLNYILAQVLQDNSYITQCAIGFSGVVFAVKVVTTHMMPRGTVLVMGFIPVNTRISCWFELVLIQILVPNASFTGHLAGILVGLAYIKGPLKYIIDVPFLGFRSFGNPGPSYTYHSGTASNTRSSVNGIDVQRYTGGLSEEEQVQLATEESLRDRHDRHPENVERIYPNLSSEQPGYPHPSAPPQDQIPPRYGWNIPEHTIPANQSHENSYDPEEVRRRRLERFATSFRT